jgi:hypothetical protein
MSEFDPQAWEEAKVMSSTGDDPPEPGTYWAQVEQAELFTSGAGDVYIRMGYRLIGGADDGYTWSMLGGSFGSEGAINAAKTHCARLGIDVVDIHSKEELDEALKGCVGRSYEIAVKQNGEWRNVYVNRDVSNEAPESDVPAPDDPDLERVPAGASDDDDIPF